ncbi:MAG: EAL domain-containing protein [Lachnospiraceae bacterium]
MKRPVILVVEDVEVYAKMAQDIFKEEYEVQLAQDGQKAITLLESGVHVDVILLDLIMPGMDGFGVLRYLKKNEKFCKIPVIVNTTDGYEKNVMKALELGAIDFVTKPYNPEVMRKIVKNVLKKIVIEQSRLQDSIDEQNFQLESFYNTMPGGVLILEVAEQLKVRFCNENCSRVFGRNKKEILNLYKENLLLCVDSEDQERFWKEIKESAEEHRMLETKIRILHADGNRRNVRVDMCFYCREERLLANAIFLDITKEVEAVRDSQKAAKELRFQTRHDRLTGIFNQWTFCEETEKMLRDYPDEEFVLVHMDIERFKVVNDLLGVKRADAILKYEADAIKQEVEKLDHGTYCRCMADKFAVCIPKKALYARKLVSQRLLEEQGLSFRYCLRFSYGIYAITDRNISVVQMIDRAAIAGETIKYNVNEYFAIYDEKLRKKMLNEQQIVSEMRTSLQNHEFCVYLQPVVDAKTDQVVSAEALVRWKHPVRGLIPPNEFVPLFEKNGFIVELDKFMRESVMDLIEERQKQGKRMVPISVNLSRVNFYNPHFCEELIEDIDKRGIDHSMIKFEITESTCTNDTDMVLNVVERLKKEKVKVLMDDFGSGYSSLNMLKEVPVDVLKIDMRFLQDIEKSEKAANIVGSVIEMSKKLDMEVIAEGVETDGQKKILMESGCSNIQGFYYSRPLPIQEFLKLL